MAPGKSGEVAAYSMLVAVFALVLLSALDGACGANEKMRGPERRAAKSPREKTEETSCLDLAMLGALSFYRKAVSPADGTRCGFRPSCSAFAAISLREQGPLVGLLMTADRLMRCHPLKKAGPDYLPLPGGKLYDPPAKNLLSDP